MIEIEYDKFDKYKIFQIIQNIKYKQNKNQKNDETYSFFMCFPSRMHVDAWSDADICPADTERELESCVGRGWRRPCESDPTVERRAWSTAECSKRTC